MEVRDKCANMGLKGDVLEKCVNTIKSDKEIWFKFLQKSELGLEEPENPVFGAILTFFSFIIGAIIPLSPYFLNLRIIFLIISSIISFSMLAIVGAFKTKITGQPKYKVAIEILIVGSIVFTYSYIIGLWFDMFMTNV